MPTVVRGLMNDLIAPHIHGSGSNTGEKQFYLTAHKHVYMCLVIVHVLYMCLVIPLYLVIEDGDPLCQPFDLHSQSGFLALVFLYLSGAERERERGRGEGGGEGQEGRCR